MNSKAFSVLTLGAVLIAPTALVSGQDQTLLDDRPAERGFTRIFNGKDLTGWEGSPETLVGQRRRHHRPDHGGEPGQAKHVPGLDQRHPGRLRAALLLPTRAGRRRGFANSGIQYRSKVVDPVNWVVHGYQADMEAGPNYTGNLYEEGMRGTLAERGEKVVWDKDGKKQVVGSVGNAAEIEASVKKGDWNDYVIIAQGNHLQQFVNGKPTIDVVDEDPAKRALSGVLALQLHAGPPMMAQFRNIRLKALK